MILAGFLLSSTLSSTYRLFFSIFLWYQLLVEFQWSSFQNREVLSSVFLRWITLVRHSRDLRVRIVNILWGVLLAWILIVCGIPWSSCQNRNHSLKRFPAVDISRVKRSSDHRVRIRERSSRRDNVTSLSAAKAWVIVLSHGINLLCFSWTMIRYENVHPRCSDDKQWQKLSIFLRIPLRFSSSNRSLFLWI